MTNEANITFQNHTLVLTGDLNFTNVMLVYQKSLSYLKQCNEAVFDFSQLKKSNSSVLALMMEWIHLSKQYNKRIIFKSIPDNLMSIAKVGGIEKMIYRYVCS